LSKGDYQVGDVTMITAKINSPTGLSSTPQTIDVYIDTTIQPPNFLVSNQIPPRGTFLEARTAWTGPCVLVGGQRNWETKRNDSLFLLGVRAEPTAPHAGCGQLANK
jgi:hypothetical protein